MGKKNRTAYTRRQFLAKSGSAGIALASTWPGEAWPQESQQTSPPNAASPTGDLAALKSTFLNPANSARPMTRWWWFGGAVTPEEITRELTLMREAGLRGAELQPLYPIAVDDPARGIRNLRYFSKEWFNVLRHAVKEARRLGLQLDLTLGSGWPYGGPFIPVELAARRLRLLSQDVAGPREFSWDLTPLLGGDEKIVATLAVPVLVSEEPDMSRSRVLTDQPKAQIVHNNRTGIGINRLNVPPGHWRIMVFVDTPTGMQVKRPTIGMEGYVIDHFSREAVQLFISAAGDRTLRELKALGGGDAAFTGSGGEGTTATGNPPFYSVFCDSLEVYGADWTSNFMKEFERRRGYDFAPYLPALWQDAGPLTPHVRYDYHLTLSELILEYFFRPLAEWAERNGMTARVQAHGAMGDVMQGYGLAHIPEGESIFMGDRYAVNVHHRRLASSAGHIYNKPVISAETYTWLRVPLFMVTLEMMKAATDVQFLDGINQIVNQGYSYSPPQAGQPGWVFYASTMVNHNNIWWRHYPHLARYIQRAASLLLQGVSVNPVAVYVPLADIYAQYGSGGLHMDVEVEKHLGLEFFQDLRQAGYDFDFINDDALARIAKVEDGKVRAGTAVYSAVIVPGARYMPPESLERLVEFARDGGFLIFTERLPEAAPGMTRQESRTARLRAALKELWADSLPARDTARRFGNGQVLLARNRAAGLAQLEIELPPDFKIIAASDSSEAPMDRGEAARLRAIENVGFLHRRVGSTDFFFVSNISEQAQDLRAQFAVGHKLPERWNPESGALEETLVFEHAELPARQAKVTNVQIRLEPFESCFIVFSDSDRGPVVTRTNWPGALGIETTGNKTQVSGMLPADGEYFLVAASGRRHHFSLKQMPKPVPINGPWQLRLGGGALITVTELRPWAELPEGKAYSGWGAYETTFEMPGLGENIEWMLDLGKVHETAEVSLNGVPLGAAWKGLRRVACRDALGTGHNSLKVDVGNLWIHKAHSLPKPDLKPLAETFGIRWGRYGEIEPESVPPSGLLGPVRLLPLKRWTVRF